MKTLALCLTGLAAFAGSMLTVSANNHPYTLPSFPAGPAIVPAQSTMQLNELNELNDVDVERRKPKTPVFEAKLDGIYMNGKPFTIKGSSYFGFETGIYVPHGLWGGNESTSLQKVADFLKSNNFNAVRLPFAVNGVLENLPIDPGLVTNEVALTQAFQGKTLRFLDVIDHTIKVFGDNKIVVMLDAHVLSPDLGITELWYTSDADKDNFENAWKIMAKRYKNTWNVFAADLKNEPHGEASWGSGNVTNDWRLASLKLATTVLKIVPRWLIFVEGMSQSSRDVEGLGSFWGENLMDLQRAQLTLPVPQRLVYSPHVYGPDVYLQSYFLNETFPDNMPAIWDLHFGFGIGKYGPFVVGEWGGKYRSDADKKWQDKFAAYLAEKNLGWFYWCINPNSGDTEGLLDNDWNTPRADKLALLSAFTGTPIP